MSFALLQSHFSIVYWEGWILNHGVFFRENREKAVSKLGRSTGRVHSTPLSGFQSTTKWNSCVVLAVHCLQHSPGFLLKSHNLFLGGIFSPTVWNKRLFQSAAHQYTYFPCSLLQIAKSSLFQAARGKIRKTDFELTKRTSVICCLWPKVPHKPGALNFSSLACILMSCVTAWHLLGQGVSRPSWLSLCSAAEVQTVDYLPYQVVAKWGSLCP